MGMGAKEILAWIGGLGVTTAALLTAAYQLFKYWGAKWLDSRFDERLQILKHQHQQEIEQLRYTISGMLDRTTKLNDREFQVLPKAWVMTNKSFWAAAQLVAPFQEIVNLDAMVPQHRETFIKESRLADWQKDELRLAPNQTQKYREMICWHDLHAAKLKQSASFRYLSNYGIFMEETLREKFVTLSGLIWNALIEYETNLQHPGVVVDRDQATTLRNQGGSLRQALETAIHARVWPVETVQSPS